MHCLYACRVVSFWCVCLPHCFLSASIEGMRFICSVLFLGVLVGCAPQESESPVEIEPPIESFVGWLLEEEGQFQSVVFADVVRAVSNCEVLPVNVNDSVDTEMLKVVEASLDAVFAELAASDNLIHQVGRVNEISRHVEDALIAQLSSMDGYQCGIPENASGELQRSGYPDIRLSHDASGRVFYLDPKIYKQGSETSSFRTFYFEPKKETNKILDDASHLIVGIAHSGKQEGRWQLESWKLVDLIDFKVRLKAEFQASNRDLYQENRVVGEREVSTTAAAELEKR